MDLTALVVVIVGTLMFFGFAVGMAFYSRRNTAEAQNLNENNNESNLMRDGN